jgi:hypothetical protein
MIISKVIIRRRILAFLFETKGKIINNLRLSTRRIFLFLKNTLVYILFLKE